MPTPTLTVPWYTQGEVPFPSTTDLQAATRSFLFMFKAFLMNQLTGGTLAGTRPGGSAWTCTLSSDGVTAGAGDNLGGGTFTAGKWVRATEGTAHSWFVLQSPAGVGPVYICVNYSGSSEGNGQILFSRSPFTGGSVTARPTATNETPLGSTSLTSPFTFFTDTVFNVAFKFGGAVNANGEFVLYSNRAAAGVFNAMYGLMNLVNTAGGEIWPHVLFGNSTSTGRGAGVLAQIQSSSTGHAMRTFTGSARQANGGIVSYSFGNTNFAGAAGQDTQLTQWTTLPIYVANVNDVGSTGWRGNLSDVYIVGSAPVGGGFPSTGAQTQMVVGDMLIPSAVPAAL